MIARRIPSYRKLMPALPCRSAILTTSAENIMTNGSDKGTIRFIYDYLEARLGLLKSMEVSLHYLHVTRPLDRAFCNCKRFELTVP